MNFRDESERQMVSSVARDEGLLYETAALLVEFLQCSHLISARANRVDGQ